MSIPDRTSNPLCHVIDGTRQTTPAPQDLFIVPLNSEAKAVLDAHFASYGSYTTVAITQVDAGRGGYGQTGEDYKALKFDLSA